MVDGSDGKSSAPASECGSSRGSGESDRDLPSWTSGLLDSLPMLHFPKEYASGLRKEEV